MRLVIVDNDQAVLELLSLDLELEGHEIVATASTADEAVRACAEHRPEVLVVDLRLGPGRNGLDVAREVTVAGHGLGLRIVLHTNYVTPAIVNEARGVGVTVVEKGALAPLRRAILGSGEIDRAADARW